MLLSSKLFNQIDTFFNGKVKVNSLEEGAKLYGGSTAYNDGIYSNIMENDFINVNANNNKLSVFIPSTVNYSEELDSIGRKYFILKYMDMIEKKYKGNEVLVYSSKGSFKDEDGTIIYDNITILTLALNKVTEEDINFFLNLGLKVKNEMTQWCVSISINDSLCLV